MEGNAPPFINEKIREGQVLTHVKMEIGYRCPSEIVSGNPNRDMFERE
jgi:hypothetical protein